MKIIVKSILALLCMLPVWQYTRAEHWTCDESKYQYDMTVYFNPVVDGTAIISFDGYEIAAFVGDECRGIATITTVSGKGSYGYIRVRSNFTNNESVSFKLYRASDKQEVAASYTTDFVAGSYVGYPSTPQEIDFNCTYSLKYVIDGETYKTVKFAFGDVITAEAVPTKAGYTFGGWSGIPTSMPANDVEVTGSFSANEHILKYVYTKDGIRIEFSSEVVAFGTPLTKKADISESGYIFSGWSDVPVTMPDNDVTITGSYTKGTYTLTYYVDGSVYHAYGHEYGDLITPEPAPTKEGHTFGGWSSIPATMPAGDVSVTGSFSINKYTVKFMSEGNIIKQEILNYGSIIAIPADPSKEGYKFTGWNPTVDATVPAKDVTYIAQFSVNSYKLTYKLDGEQYKVVTLEYGTTIVPETEPTKTGYTFSKWSEIPATMPDHDVVITGQFTVNSYNLIYKLDGNLYKEYTLNYGTTITPETPPYKENCTFSGWSEIPATMPAHDVEVTGTFKYPYLRGDVNNDGSITVGDISAVASIILGTATATLSREAADANLDGDITVGDISSIAGYILNGSFSNARSMIPQTTDADLSMGTIAITPGRQIQATINLASQGEVNGLQFDIQFPKGITIKKDTQGEQISLLPTLTNNQSLAWAEQANKDTRLLTYSTTGKTYKPGIEGLITMTLEADPSMAQGEYEIRLKNIILSVSNGTTVERHDKTIRVAVSGTTDIRSLSENNQEVRVYNLSGIRQNCLQKGINIIGNSKIIIK